MLKVRMAIAAQVQKSMLPITVMALAVGSSALAAGEPAAYSAWQQIAVLTFNKLENAAASCGFAVNEKAAADILASAGLSVESAHSRTRTAELQQQIDGDADAFRSTKDAACKRAWEQYGADAAPGVRDLLLK